MSVVLVVAPHPDDETLGCGGTLLRHAAAGDELHWLIATAMTEAVGYDRARIAARAAQIEAVHQAYGFAALHQLDYPTTRLDALPLAELAARAKEVFEKVQPEVVYLPNASDAHSDHARVFEMCGPATKWFRQASLRQVLGYETLSETGFQLDPRAAPFRPTVYVDIAAYLERKLEILGLYEEELAAFPFPRSPEAVRAQAALRGAESGFAAAEAFALLRLRR